jgi:hypothetical protein
MTFFLFACLLDSVVKGVSIIRTLASVSATVVPSRHARAAAACPFKHRLTACPLKHTRAQLESA